MIKDDVAVKARNEAYNAYVKKYSPSSAGFKSLFHAFLVGGFTCLIAQLVAESYHLLFPQMDLEFVASVTSVTIITAAILITGFGWYDVIARVGGAGSFLPITGFANAMSSASLEYKTEGIIFGSNVKTFTVVGPVIVNGVVWSSVAGLVRLIVETIV